MKRVLDLATPGPVTLNKAMAEGMALVPPGRAYRVGEYQRLWMVKNTGTRPDIIRTRDPAEAEEVRIRRGRRSIVRKGIWSAVKAGHIRLYKDDEGVEWLIASPREATKKEGD